MKVNKNTKITDSRLMLAKARMILILSIFFICIQSEAQTFASNGVYDIEITSGGTMSVTAVGADGGNHQSNQFGGSGGNVTASFSVTTGDFIRVIVGESGKTGGNDGGGGGGTAVINCGGSIANCNSGSGNLLLVAGAGGGASNTNGGGGAVTTAGSGNNGADNPNVTFGNMARGGQGVNSASQSGCNIATNTGALGGSGFGAGGFGWNTAGGGGAGYTGGDAGQSANDPGDGGSNFINGSGTNNPGTQGGGLLRDGSVTISGIGTSTVSAIDCAGSALPVELVNFTAVVEDEISIQLSWLTSSEINNQGFNIEHSIDSRNWNTLGFIPGFGHSQTEQQYLFIDRHPISGTNYYRLKQIDYDGVYKYSKVISIKFDNSENGFTVFPNPSNGLINIQIDNPQSQKAIIKISDNLGRQIWESGLVEGESSWIKEIEIEGDGIYFVSTLIGNKIYHKRVIITDEK